MPPQTLGRPRLGQRRSIWSLIFGVSEPSSSIGSLRVEADDPAIVHRYSGMLMGRAPLAELHDDPVDVGTVDELRGAARVREIQFGAGVARSNRRADALTELLNAARAERAGTIQPTRQDTAAQAADFARSFHWSLSIPGTHYSGLSNQQLLEILEGQGRPFAQDTPELRDHVRDRLVAAFGVSEWDAARAIAVTARAVREWIVRRIDEQGLDVELEPLDPDYRDEKVAEGFSSKIGVRTGAWRGSLANGSVEVTA